MADRIGKLDIQPPELPNIRVETKRGTKEFHGVRGEPGCRVGGYGPDSMPSRRWKWGPPYRLMSTIIGSSRFGVLADSESFPQSPAAGPGVRPRLGRLQFTALPRLGDPPLRRFDPRAQAPVELGFWLKPKSLLKPVQPPGDRLHRLWFSCGAPSAGPS